MYDAALDVLDNFKLLAQNVMNYLICFFLICSGYSAMPEVKEANMSKAK
jgi:hypothetical protein